MKKLLVSILTSAMIALGLVATVEVPAQAACGYSTPCIKTKTKAFHPKQITGTSITVKVRVRPVNGTGTPTGTVRVAIKKYNGTFEVKQTKPYSGGKIPFTFTGLPKKGKYRVLAKFFPAPGSVYLKSKSRTNFFKTK